MNDPETFLLTIEFGACAAFIAASLYFITSRGERSDFHLLPSSAREWTHFGFRTLIFGAFCSVLFFLSIDVAISLLALSAFLLFSRPLLFLLIAGLARFVNSIAHTFRSTVVRAKRAIRWNHFCRTAYRYRWLLFFIFVLGGAVGYTSHQFHPKLYKARGLMEIRPTEIEKLMETFD